MRATGVEYVHNPHISDNSEIGENDYGAPRKINTRREIIMCAGAIHTPQILMLSGIGPRKHLEQFEIKCRADLPVGEGLRVSIK